MLPEPGHPPSYEEILAPYLVIMQTAKTDRTGGMPKTDRNGGMHRLFLGYPGHSQLDSFVIH